MQFQSTIQVTVIDDSTATGISYALVLEAPVPEDEQPNVKEEMFTTPTACEACDYYSLMDQIQNL